MAFADAIDKLGDYAINSKGGAADLGASAAPGGQSARMPGWMLTAASLSKVALSSRVQAKRSRPWARRSARSKPSVTRWYVLDTRTSAYRRVRESSAERRLSV